MDRYVRAEWHYKVVEALEQLHFCFDQVPAQEFAALPESVQVALEVAGHACMDARGL